VIIFRYITNSPIHVKWGQSIRSSKRFSMCRVFQRCFRDPNRVPRISNRVPKIWENYHQVPRNGENRVPRFREIGPYRSTPGT